MVTNKKNPIRTVLKRAALAVILGSAAIPAAAETLGDTLVAAYRHSALLDQNRAVLRAADEDVATAMAALRPVVEWALQHQFTDFNGAEATTTTLGRGVPPTTTKTTATTKTTSRRQHRQYQKNGVKTM